MTEAAPHSRQVELSEFSLHYWEWSGDPVATIVCLHPSSHYGRIWEWVAQRLAPDYRVLAPDQRGHGDSGRPASGTAAEDYAADVEALAEQLGLERFVLAGHSLGARTGMVYAALHPARVSHLILVGGPHFSGLHPGADVEYWQTNTRNTAARPRRQRSATAAVEALRAQYPHFPQAALEHVVEHNTRAVPDGGVEWKYDPAFVADGLTHALDDLRPYAARISCPLLILRPERSWELTPERLPEVEAAFPYAPNRRTVTVPGGVGNLELEQPAEVAAAIRDFLGAPAGISTVAASGGIRS
jgi:2-(acetamidomethylene)succinate hydrolase